MALEHLGQLEEEETKYDILRSSESRLCPLGCLHMCSSGLSMFGDIREPLVCGRTGRGAGVQES